MSIVSRAMLSVALATLAVAPGPAQSASRIHVVATTTDLKALTEAVGGALVNVDALARGLAGLLRVPARRRAMGEEGRRRVATLTWERAADQAHALFHEMVGARG